MMRLNRKGFTLVEVLIVVAIIGLLAAIAIPNLMRVRTGAMGGTCESNRGIYERGIKYWATEHNKDGTEMQAVFGKTGAEQDLTLVTEAHIVDYFDVSKAVCPKDGTTHYKSKVSDDGVVTVTCTNHP